MAHVEKDLTKLPTGAEITSKATGRDLGEGRIDVMQSVSQGSEGSRYGVICLMS